MWQEWDALHIARVRLANPERDLLSYLSKTIERQRVSCQHGPSCRSMLRNVQQEWDAVRIARGRLANPTRDLPPHLSTTIRSTRDSSQRRLSSRLRCEMRSRSMTRRTSRADVWATRSGKASPTCLEQDKDNVTFLASWTLSSYLLRNAWQKCDAAHIANGMFVVNGAGSVAGVGRGARRALNA